MTLNESNEQLVKMIQSGCDNEKELLEELYKQNRGLIQIYAKRWARGLTGVEDLMQEGFFALVDAAKTHDSNKGAFSSWLGWHLTACYYRAVCHSGAFRVPDWAYDLMIRWKKEYERYIVMYGKKPTTEIMSWILDVKLETAKKIQAAVRKANTTSLDARVMVNDREGDSITLLDTIADPRDNIGEVTDRIAAEELSSALWDLVESIDKQGATVIKAKYREGKTFSEIGKKFGLSRQRIDQIEKKTLKKLRKSQDVARLYSFIEPYSAGLHGTGLTVFQHTETSATERAAMRIYEREHKARGLI